jgi:hypothetical protein
VSPSGQAAAGTELDRLWRSLHRWTRTGGTSAPPTDAVRAAHAGLPHARERPAHLIVMLGLSATSPRRCRSCAVCAVRIDAHITWAVEPAAAPLRHHAAIGVVLFDRPGGAPAFLRFLRAVRAQQPDLAVDLQRPDGLASRFSGARVDSASSPQLPRRE